MIENLCYHCFQHKPDGAVKCPNCNYDPSVDAGKYPLALPPGTVVGGKYILGHVLGQGGFGITYIALDHQTKERVAVKEYFPDGMVTRTEPKTVSAYSGQRQENFAYGKACFLDEAETLAKFIGNPGIIRVYSYFEENGTAYFSMEYVDGCSLQKYVRSAGGKIGWDAVKKDLYPIMDALSEVHAKGIIHRDVTPDNIFILKSGGTKLLDFGAARYSLGEKSRSLDVIIKHGFAPMEQYTRRGRQGPYTDVYSLAATMYYVLSGRLPQDSIDRLEEDQLADLYTLGVRIPAGAEEAIMKAMSLRHGDRYQTMAEFKNALIKGDTEEESPAPLLDVKPVEPAVRKEFTAPPPPEQQRSSVYSPPLMNSSMYASKSLPGQVNTLRSSPAQPKHDPSYEAKLRFGCGDEDRPKTSTTPNLVPNNYSNMYGGSYVPATGVQSSKKKHSGIHPLAIIGVASLCILCAGVFIPIALGYMKRAQEVKNQATSSQVETQAPTQPTTKATEPHTEPTTEGPLDATPLTIVCWTDADLQNMFDVYHVVYPNAQLRYQNCGGNGAEAATQYASYLNSGDDVDLFIAEAGWMRNYIPLPEYTTPISKLGINDSEYKNAYPYTLEYGRNLNPLFNYDPSKNKNGALMAVTWQACAGGYCYNTDIAKEYLGVNSPDEMQKKIDDWDGFWATAEELRKASNGKVTMATTVGGVWQAYSCAMPYRLVSEDETKYVFDGLSPFIKQMKNAINKGYINPKIQQWTTDWTNAGLNENTMGYFYSTWCLGEGAQLEQNGGTAGNWRICAGPQEFFWGGSWLCLSPNCNSYNEAKRFVRFFTVDEESMELYALYSGDFVNNHKVMKKIVADRANSNALLGGQDQFAVLDDVAMNIYADYTMMTVYDQSCKDIFLYVFKENYGSSENTILQKYVNTANGEE